MTLETAKLLKENGWDKKTKNIFSNYFLIDYSDIRTSTTFYNRRGRLAHCEMQILSDEQSDLLQKDGITTAMDFETYPSPSLEELLAVMPHKINYEGGDGNTDAYLSISKHENNSYSVYYKQPNDIVEYYSKIYPDPTEAVALLWIQLRKEGIA